MSSLFGRQRNILEYTLSSVLRRKGRHASLLLIFIALVFLLSSVMFFAGSLREEASYVLRNAPEMVVQKMVAGRQVLMPVSFAAEAGKVRGVSAVRPRLWGYFFSPVMKANYTVMVPDDFGHDSGEIVIGKGISRVLKAGVGERLSLMSPQGEPMVFVVVDVLSHVSELVTSDLMLVSQEDFRAFFGVPSGFVTDLAVSVGNPREADTIAWKLIDRLSGVRVIQREEILRTYDAVFGWRSGLVVALLGASAFAFLILVWDRASGLSAEERREIGILKAVGWDISDVILMKLWEGAVISLSAFLLGTVLAYAHVYFGAGMLFTPVLKGWSVLYPSFRLVPHVDLFGLLTLFFLSVVPYTLVTVIPTWRTALIDPDTVMKT